MGRLDLVKELQDLEVKKVIIGEQLRAIKNDYFNKGTITFKLETEDFKYSESKQTTVTFNEKLMVEYLELELNVADEQARQIIEKLSN